MMRLTSVAISYQKKKQFQSTHKYHNVPFLLDIAAYLRSKHLRTWLEDT